MDELNARVGSRVTVLRAARGISLSVLAAEAGIGKGTLSQIEAGTRNATLATLYALAGPLGVPLATLLDDRIGAEVAAHGVSARLLDLRRHDHGSTVETYALTLDDGADRTSPSHGPGVLEHVHVTRGRLRVGLSGHEVTVGPGDSHTWTSDGPHRYVAVDGAAEAVLVITSPG